MKLSDALKAVPTPFQAVLVTDHLVTLHHSFTNQAVQLQRQPGKDEWKIVNYLRRYH